MCVAGSFHGGNWCETSKIDSALQNSNLGDYIRSHPLIYCHFSFCFLTISRVKENI
ncbi:hypothetical protein MtrunA17_Chr2g0312611 [Medicago truncatula]|uniref:Uncharacterized protein n=1 Tax=Medicago truncatula TaxID=3880 RepID=A0A396JDX6_MEDTR|nr:hypothetical protein MtrunA17_Chr2g0312611 [Medicago truncatula]